MAKACGASARKSPGTDVAVAVIVPGSLVTDGIEGAGISA